MASDMYFVQAEYVYNQALNYKRIVKYAGEPLSHPESVASSAVINFCSRYYSLCPHEFANNSILSRLLLCNIFILDNLSTSFFNSCPHIFFKVFSH